MSDRGNVLLLRKRGSGTAASSSHHRPGDGLDGDARARFEALPATRLRVAQTRNVPSSIVTSNPTLREMGQPAAQNERRLQKVHDIDAAKVNECRAT